WKSGAARRLPGADAELGYPGGELLAPGLGGVVDIDPGVEGVAADRVPAAALVHALPEELTVLGIRREALYGRRAGEESDAVVEHGAGQRRDQMGLGDVGGDGVHGGVGRIGVDQRDAEAKRA